MNPVEPPPPYMTPIKRAPYPGVWDTFNRDFFITPGMMCITTGSYVEHKDGLVMSTTNKGTIWDMETGAETPMVPRNYLFMFRYKTDLIFGYHEGPYRSLRLWNPSQRRHMKQVILPGNHGPFVYRYYNDNAMLGPESFGSPTFTHLEIPPGKAHFWVIDDNKLIGFEKDEMVVYDLCEPFRAKINLVPIADDIKTYILPFLFSK